MNSIRKYADKLKPVEEETEDAWIKKALEKEYAFWDNVPSARRKDNDEMDDFKKMLEDLY